MHLSDYILNPRNRVIPKKLTVTHIGKILLSMESINYSLELNPLLNQQVQYTPSHPTALLSTSIFEQHNNNK